MSDYSTIELPDFLKAPISTTPPEEDFDFPTLEDAEIQGDEENPDVEALFGPEDNLTEEAQPAAAAPEPAPVEAAAPKKRGRKPKAEKAAEAAPKPPKDNLKEVAAAVAAIAEPAKDEAENPRVRQGGNSGVAGEVLKSIVERIEHLVEDKQAIQGDISDVFAEAKGQGFDCKVIREVLKIRKKPAHERAEEEAILELYLFSLGME